VAECNRPKVLRLDGFHNEENDDEGRKKANASREENI
jgi:hypothetical protein